MSLQRLISGNVHPVRLCQVQIGFFTNTQNWQHWHYCQLCIPIYLQFPSLFATYDKGGAGTAGNPVQVGNTAFMRFIKCQPHIIIMLLYPQKLLILLYCLDNICWWRCQCRLIRNASIVCYPLAPKLSAKDF